jgi:hypothetical protein
MPETATPAYITSLIRHFDELRDGTHGASASRRDKATSRRPCNYWRPSPARFSPKSIRACCSIRGSSPRRDYDAQGIKGSTHPGP